MDIEESQKRYEILQKLQKERLVCRTLSVLKAKQTRIREDLNQLLTHLPLLISSSNRSLTDSEILTEAINRLEDPDFSQLLLHIIEELK